MKFWPDFYDKKNFWPQLTYIFEKRRKKMSGTKICRFRSKKTIKKWGIFRRKFDKKSSKNGKISKFSILLFRNLRNCRFDHKIQLGIPRNMNELCRKILFEINFRKMRFLQMVVQKKGGSQGGSGLVHPHIYLFTLTFSLDFYFPKNIRKRCQFGQHKIKK